MHAGWRGYNRHTVYTRQYVRRNILWCVCHTEYSKRDHVTPYNNKGTQTERYHDE
jgi:hypothetical protein